MKKAMIALIIISAFNACSNKKTQHNFSGLPPGVDMKVVKETYHPGKGMYTLEYEVTNNTKSKIDYPMFQAKIYYAGTVSEATGGAVFDGESFSPGVSGTGNFSTILPEGRPDSVVVFVPE